VKPEANCLKAAGQGLGVAAINQQQLQHHWSHGVVFLLKFFLV
jgi:hypothetical protein